MLNLKELVFQEPVGNLRCPHGSLMSVISDLGFFECGFIGGLASVGMQDDCETGTGWDGGTFGLIIRPTSWNILRIKSSITSINRQPLYGLAHLGMRMINIVGRQLKNL